MQLNRILSPVLHAGILLAFTAQSESLFEIEELRELCGNPTELERCDLELDLYWTSRTAVHEKTLLSIAEIYLDLGLFTKKSGTPYRNRAFELLSQLAKAHPNDSQYPAFEAYAVTVYDKDPIRGLSLAKATVDRFPDQSGAHGVFATLLGSSRFGEMEVDHRRQQFVLALADESNSMVNLLFWANNTRKSILRVYGPRQEIEFIEFAKDQLRWSEWSDRVIDQVLSERSDGKLGPSGALHVMREFCNGSVVDLDNGALCGTAVQLVHEKLPIEHWKNDLIVSEVRHLAERFATSNRQGLGETLGTLQEISRGNKLDRHQKERD